MRIAGAPWRRAVWAPALLAPVLLPISVSPGAAAVSAASGSPSMVVSGHLSYPVPGGFVNPVREAIVEVIDKRPHASPCPFRFDSACVLATVVSDDQGGFNFGKVPTSSPSGTRNLVVRFYAEGSVNGHHRWFVTPPNHPRFAYHIDIAVPHTTSAFVRAEVGASKTVKEAFALFDVARIAADWADANGVAFSTKLRFPAAKTNTDPGGKTANIAAADAYGVDSVLHEMGHVVEFQNSLIRSPSLGGGHNFGTDETVSRGKSDGVALAWQEGFADFFAVQVREETDVARLPNRPGMIGHSYIDAAVGTNVPLDDKSGYNGGPNGEGDELSVARVLWTLTNGTILPAPISLDQMVSQFKGVETLSDAVDRVRMMSGFGFGSDHSAADAQLAHAVGCLLADNAVAPRVVAIGTPLPGRPPPSVSVDDPPTYIWSQGGTPRFHLNHFDVYFYDRDWKFLAMEKDVPNNGGVTTPGMWAWTPNPKGAVWQKLRMAVDSSGDPPLLHVEVEGRETGSGLDTGPYPSCGADHARILPGKVHIVFKGSGTATRTIQDSSGGSSTSTDQASWTAVYDLDLGPLAISHDTANPAYESQIDPAASSLTGIDTTSNCIFGTGTFTRSDDPIAHLGVFLPHAGDGTLKILVPAYWELQQTGGCAPYALDDGCDPLVVGGSDPTVSIGPFTATISLNPETWQPGTMNVNPETPTSWQCTSSDGKFSESGSVQWSGTVTLSVPST